MGTYESRNRKMNDSSLARFVIYWSGESQKACKQERKMGQLLPSFGEGVFIGESKAVEPSTLHGE